MVGDSNKWKFHYPKLLDSCLQIVCVSFSVARNLGRNAHTVLKSNTPLHPPNFKVVAQNLKTQQYSCNASIIPSLVIYCKVTINCTD